jgi:hypothetical protein
MTITLTLTHEEERYSAVCKATIPARWIGTTPKITFGGNTVLNGEEYPIIGNTRQEVIERVVSELKSRGMHGTLKVINA